MLALSHYLVSDLTYIRKYHITVIAEILLKLAFNIITLTPWVSFLFYFSILIHCSCMHSFQTSSNTWLHVPLWSNLILFCLCSFIVSLLNSLLMFIYVLGLLCFVHGIFTYCLFVCFFVWQCNLLILRMSSIYHVLFLFSTK